jgi:hypothetical protein
MWLIESIKLTARWFASLARRMFRAAPGATATVVLTTLFAQIFQLFAMVLPLKVVLLMGSHGIPRFFPDMFKEFDRGKLVVLLSATAVVLYGAYLLMRSISERAAQAGAETLDSRNRKLSLFPNQHALSRDTYRSVASASAGILFSAIAWLGITAIYPKLGLELLGIVCTVFAAICVWGARNQTFQDWFLESYSDLLEYVSAAGLFLCLALFVSDYLSETMPSLLIAIISILLARQLLSRLPSSLTTIARLKKRQLKIDSLFFHGVPFDDRPGKSSENIFELLQPSAQQNWLPNLLDEIGDLELLEPPTWTQLGIPNVLALRCRTKQADSELRDLLIKLYPSQKQHLADHEITLLSEEHIEQISPPLTHATHIDNRQCLVYDISGLHKITAEDGRELSTRLLMQTADIEPSANLTRRYLRSKNALPQRLKTRSRWLSLVAQSSQERRLVEELEKQLPYIRSRIEALPHYIRNPDTGSNTLLAATNGSVRATHWARWSLEPVGADWPVGKAGDLFIEISRQTKRRSLLQVEPNDVQIAALLFQFDRLCNRQKFTDAISLIPELVSRRPSGNVRYRAR